MLPTRICQHFFIERISVSHDPENNLVWVLTDEELTENGDIERETTFQGRRCNRSSLVKFISKIYKPVLWDNIGIAFTTFENYKKNIKSKSKYSYNNVNNYPKEEKVRPVDEDVECFKNALSKLDSSEPKILTMDAFLSIPNPPKAFFKPGKKRESEQIEIDTWKNMLIKEGYSLDDYRKMAREHKKKFSMRKYGRRSDSEDESN